MKLRVLVVDDTSLFRRIISDALQRLPDVEVVGTAPNGKIALERAVSPWQYHHDSSEAEVLERIRDAEVVVSNISWMISGRVVALDSTAPVSG